MIERIAARFDGRFLRGYVRGKLRTDPIYAAAFDILCGSPWPVLDVGCGIGLFALYLRERGFREKVYGVDFDERKIAHARRVAEGESGLQFSVEEAATAREWFVGNIVILDVLHYLDRAHQCELLEKAAGQVAPGGCCIIRDTPRDRTWRFRATQFQEVLLRGISWMKAGPRYYPTVEEIIAPFRERGFRSDVRPLWGRTPFNSHLFVFRKA